MNEILAKWGQVEETLEKLAANTKVLCQETQAWAITSMQYMKTYTNIYEICVIKNKDVKSTEIMYKKYIELLTIYLQDIVKQLESCHGMIRIRKFRDIWNSYKSYLRLLGNLFAYLDRFFIPGNSLMSLEKRGLTIYFQIVIASQLYKQTETLYLAELDNVRDGDYSKATVLKQFVEILIQIKAKDRMVNPVLEFVESSYIEVAGQYYKRKFKELESLPCGDYLKQVTVLYAKEQEIFNKCYQYQPSWDILRKQFSKDLLLKYSENLLEKSTGLIAMLENRQVENLKLFNSMYNKLDCFSDQVKRRFGEYFQKELLRFLSQKARILQTLNSPGQVKSVKIDLMRELFKFNREKLDLFEECFHDNHNLLNIYKFAVEKILNQYNVVYNISETLALYSDNLMRKKNLGIEEFQEQLKQIFIIFNFLIDKDVYLKDYTDYLADRLIFGVSNDEMKDYEKSFISKLKQNCGVVYTQMVESILSDHTASGVENDNFREYLDKKFNKKNFEVRVINESLWPHQQTFPLKLPEEMQALEKIFTDYFNSCPTYKFRFFKWSHLMSRLTFRMELQKGIEGQKFEWCDLSMNVLQGVLMYMIYKRRPGKIHQSEILSEFQQVQRQLLLNNLSVLWNSNSPIIIRTTDETGANYFEFNTSLVAKRIEIKYTYTKSSVQRKHSEIEDDRSLAIQMSIVKVMKTRKKMRFDQLVKEVVLLQKVFNPTIKQIKECIQRMLQKQYLERDSVDISEYRYRE